MKKIAVVFASAGLLALAACGEKPAEEANNANAVVENVVVDNAMNAVANASNVAENATNAANATNAM
ncbi:hypothetical protein [Sphingobium subterraneum]|uniref:Circumsporozoite protein n=1 Tax=Sphingobium subterraneum TaxID=627688 RepID=A0A841IV45_9SPHN|nr:hypothetical protein [Sphingobium subterraneum]MBB6122547.1 hypothetical protein [Sphingobium subterraneum]